MPLYLEVFLSCFHFSQPFDLDEFHRDLKANQIKVSKAQLMNILDAMVIIYLLRVSVGLPLLFVLSYMVPNRGYPGTYLWLF